MKYWIAKDKVPKSDASGGAQSVWFFEKEPSLTEHGYWEKSGFNFVMHYDNIGPQFPFIVNLNPGEKRKVDLTMSLEPAPTIGASP